MKPFILPFLVVLFGAGWLLSEMKLFDPARMVWTLGLLASGVLVFTYLGLNRTTFLIGGMFLVGSALSLVRYAGWVTPEQQLPILVIVFGLLMGVNSTGLIPADQPEKT
jgi:hypothetical protein